MRRDEVEELHYITAIENVESILERGILSHSDSEAIPHRSVADPEVQAIRSERWIPGGLRLHEYVNLFFNARNAMLSEILFSDEVDRRVPVDEVTILQVSPLVMDIEGVVITEINAAAYIYPRWHTVEEGLPRLDRDEIFARYWTSSRRHKQRMMAEVLVPHRVGPGLIEGAYVASEQAATILSEVAPTLGIEVRPYLFFRGQP